MANHRPGGGLKSRQVVSKPVKTGRGARGVNVRWPAQVGNSRGNRVQIGMEGGGGKILTGVRASPYKPPNFNPVPQGNKLAAATKCGPGGSREIFKSGSQHGLVDRQNNPKGRSFDD